ncbi:TIGR01244 family sulfur transferase [Defluviimonas sp. WL0050]|uniref:TIGR01244 family sulfur transferase n=1 Tax=Albidovulum litorale TaxID=2984134 RepID=A0ABT2ZQH0_9RHOB|nr:TIGR01244 family sulfur transferase [Defluviimonas sp. WL0050]MCV2873239.1 TIGR01244 family sulfur transferase [Defluviimonas sp. WL0050]
MEIRQLTPTYAVSPQIAPEEVAAIRAAGFTMIINNRPDAEIPADLRADAMRVAAEAAGLTYVVNPVIGGAITMENVAQQRAAIDAATGPILAYCASGNRSSIVWALANAGREPTNALITTPARWGYNLEPFRATIDQLATG